jgi:RecA/RadA recombinase
MSAKLDRLHALLDDRKLAGTILPAHATASVGAVSSGQPAVDRTTGGGWPKGELSELIGPRSSGRTSALMAAMADVTRTGGIVALVDTCDRFDSASAERAGVLLPRLLWVRGPALVVEHARASLVERAVADAVRACDLIIRAGGFTLIVLDLADIPLTALRRLPYATWMRLAHANEGKPTACLLVADTHVGRSARGVSVALSADRRWLGDSVQSRRFQGLACRPARAAFNDVATRRVAVS